MAPLPHAAMMQPMKHEGRRQPLDNPRPTLLALPLLLLACSLACLQPRAAAGAALAYNFSNTFGDSMVLQRHAPLVLSGHGDCAAGCTLVVGNASQKVHGEDASRWTATLPPMQASSTPLTVALHSGSATAGSPLARLEDVLIGDLVLVSG